jgi:N-acetyl sugar amidotransferase
MDTSDPEIRFDKFGICNHCNEFIQKTKCLANNKPDLNGLHKMFESIKARNTAKGTKYDAIVGVSGGCDSSYATHLAHKYGLKLLAVHVDNGWNSGLANVNIKKILDSTGIDYACKVLPWKNFTKLQKAFLKASVPEADAPFDIAIYRWQLEFASKYNVKDIISGGNMSGEGILPKSWHYNDRDLTYAKAILKISNMTLSDYKGLSCGFVREAYFRMVKKIKIHSPLNLIGYDKEKAKLELSKLYDWIDYPMKHGESKYTRFLQSYYMYVKHGIDYRRTWLSCNICLGTCSRAEALEELKKLPYDLSQLEEEIEYIAKKIKISSTELKSLISLPPKWYFDYPNQMNVLGRIYDLYRFLHKKEKLTNF